MGRRTRKATDTPERLDARIEKARSRELPRADRGDTRTARLDGWGSILTGIGDENRDRRLSHRITGRRHSYEELAAVYRYDDMAARIVDRPAEDMIREGWDLGVGEDEEIADAVEERCDELNVDAVICDALKKSRFSGGAAIYVGARDRAGDPALPLDESRLDEISHLVAFDAREIYPASYYADPLAPRYGEPASYYLRGMAGYGAGQVKTASATSLRVVHESRIIRFPGVVTNRLQARETLGWGDSVLERPLDVVRDFQVGWHSASSLLVDFAQGVFKMKGLAEVVSAGDGQAIHDRMALIERQRSVLRAVLLDEEESFERQATPMAGLPETLTALAVRLSGAADIPVTLLLGQSPAGLNATGASDVRNYYDRCRAGQREKVLPALKRILRLLFLAKLGPTKGVEPKKWRVEFRPLWTPTELEESTIRKNDADADAARVNSGVLMPEEIAISRYSGSSYGRELRIDATERKKFLVENPLGEAPEPEPDEPGGDEDEGGEGEKKKAPPEK